MSTVSTMPSAPPSSPCSADTSLVVPSFAAWADCRLRPPLRLASASNCKRGGRGVAACGGASARRPTACSRHIHGGPVEGSGEGCGQRNAKRARCQQKCVNGFPWQGNARLQEHTAEDGAEGGSSWLMYAGGWSRRWERVGEASRGLSGIDATINSSMPPSTAA
eukprot:364930-Chlamydomonas_euryale.AAC.27